MLLSVEPYKPTALSFESSLDSIDFKKLAYTRKIRLQQLLLEQQQLQQQPLSVCCSCSRRQQQQQKGILVHDLSEINS